MIPRLAEAFEFASLPVFSVQLPDPAANQCLNDGRHQLAAMLQQLQTSDPATLAHRVPGDTQMVAALQQKVRELNQRFPDHALLAAVLAQGLALGRFHICLHVFQAEVQQQGFFTSNKPKIEACHYSLLAAFDLMTSHALGYSPVPADVWRECHQLYRYVLAQGWDNKSVGGKEDTLGTLYRRLLLLGMAASNRMDLARIVCLINIVVEGAAHVQLLPLAAGADASGFSIDLYSDMPPRFGQHRRTYLHQDQHFLLGTHRALQHWEEKSQKVAIQDATTQLERQLVLRLRQEWVLPPQRRQLRLRSKNQETVHLHVGLDACWQMLNDPAGYDKAPLPMSVCNLSAAGYLLSGKLGSVAIRSGELVMVQRDQRAWLLGVVRWINRLSPRGDTEFGIEIIGKTPLAIMVTPVVTHPGEQPQQAIRLPATSRLNQQDVLVMPGKLYQALRQFEVIHAGGSNLVKAHRLLHQTGYFQFIEVRPENR